MMSGYNSFSISKDEVLGLHSKHTAGCLFVFVL